MLDVLLVELSLFGIHGHECQTGRHDNCESGTG
jgi:hypothetical protein